MFRVACYRFVTVVVSEGMAMYSTDDASPGSAPSTERLRRRWDRLSSGIRRRQGNGEVNLTALECAYKEIEIQPIVRKDLRAEWPWPETKSHCTRSGAHVDLMALKANGHEVDFPTR
jgi:hypothetical protein